MSLLDRILGREENEIIVPHLGKKLTFSSSAMQGTYFQAAEQLEKASLLQPILAETSSLVYSAWQDPDNSYSKDIIQKLKNNLLWGFTGIRYSDRYSKEGVFFEDNPKIKKESIYMSIYMNTKELERRLKEGDPRVRHVKYGYKTEEQLPSELERNPFIQALAGKEGAEKLAEVASKYKNNPYLWAFENVNEDTIRVSALYSRGVDRGRLYVDGIDHPVDRDGFVFGVRHEGRSRYPTLPRTANAHELDTSTLPRIVGNYVDTSTLPRYAN